MGNQQAKTLVLSDYDTGWLAGFMDGEGCFNFTERREKGQRNSWRPIVTIVNTHVSTLEKCVSILDAAGVAHYIRWYNPNNPKYAWRWDLQIAGHKRLLRLLNWITPHLFTKQKQAEGILDFLNLRAPKGPGDHYGNEEMGLIRGVRHLNQRGPRD